MDSKKRPNRKEEEDLEDKFKLHLDPDALPNDPHVDRILERYIRALGSYVPKDQDRSLVPGIAVVVRRGHEIVHLNGYGYANIKHKKKITPDTLFDLGSLSKQFTAVAALILILAKEINKEDFISKVFSEFPRYADDITVEQLIHHTSALPDYLDIHVATRGVEIDWYDSAMLRPDDWYPRMANRRDKEITNKDVVRWIASQALLPRKPNTEFEYSNSGYVVLAELVERVSQTRFGDFLKQKVFDPLEMNDTFVFDETFAFPEDARQVVNHAACYNGVKGPGFVPVGYTPLNFVYGDGNLHTTIVDLAKWDLDLTRFDYLDLMQDNPAENIRDLLWAPVKTKNRARVNYGAGWNLLHHKYEDEVEVRGKLVTKDFESSAEYHHGVWLGWRSYFARATRWVVPPEGKSVDPKTWESLGIIILTNCSLFKTENIAQHISQIYWGTLKKDNIINRFDLE